MARGGARNRSGPQADPKSGRSDRRNLGFVTLPSEGYDGKAPDWPFPKGTTRERAVWRKVWKYPQAAQWIKEPWRWETIAMWVRWKVRAESSEASAADAAAMHRLADQIGMTPAGLKENGWQIAADEVAAVRAEKPATADTAAAPAAPSRRLRAVPGGGGA
ncbi:hypothetical protein [Rhodococcus aetherivorans]|uniref:hypothetical protein n=1 Tax=Rhodococcus aetherivorans TaxID=191292 RepID=UPI0002D24415|nr:hypothetical protein [Rhodococcus aetherivorans]CCW14616.1 hypothetical protein EBESD8_51860 [Rhodococcus aetherivorans]